LLDTPALQAVNISKTFPGVKALDKMNLSVQKGQVLAIVGENGAGKSTLIKILSGALAPDDGDVFRDGKPVCFRNTADAKSFGIHTVYQELSLFPARSISENVFANRYPESRFGLVDYKTLRNQTRELLSSFGLGDIDPDALVGSLNLGYQQLIEIIRATSFQPKILILDEPTSALTISDTQVMFGVIKKLKQLGTAVLYISHRLDEIFEIADHLTIMRDGTLVESASIRNMTKAEIVKKMVGRDVAYNYGKGTSHIGDEVLRVESLNIKGLVNNVSFNLRKGEILGIGGLEGSGRTELISSLFGMQRILSGRIYLNGHEIEIRSPKDAIKHKFAYITKDRKKLGLFERMSIEMNILSGNLDKFCVHGFLINKPIRQATNNSIEKFDIRTSSLHKPIFTLSGGNQQKVLLAMWFMRDPDILLVDEPTRGIDVGSKEQIHRLLRDMAKAGKAILMVSSDMPELLSASDRVLVMSNGYVSGVLSDDEINEYNVMQLAIANRNNDNEQ
jgi:ABC-type sugar transport system ATPase subunit